MNRKSAFAAGLLLAISFTVWAANGFPSRPRFQSVGIGATAPSTGGMAIAAATGTSLVITPAAGQAAITATGSGNNTASVSLTSGAAGNAGVATNISSEGVCLVSNGSAGAGICNMPAGLYGLRAQGSQPIDINASGGFTLNGTRTVPRVYCVDFTMQASPNINANSPGLTWGIVRNSLGNFTLTHNLGTAGYYVMVTNRTGDGFVRAVSLGANTFVITALSTAGALADIGASMACMYLFA